MVYIHGFYGNDQSFQSFPAHVHSLLVTLLSESHVVHSKIYPRYKTYRAIEVARDKFSAWLEPHESPTTDVILVGHSMGGLLAAEVALMVRQCNPFSISCQPMLTYLHQPNPDPYVQRPFKHRILGTLSLDSPFLGLHPGIVVSGIASLFQMNSNDGTASNPASPPVTDGALSPSPSHRTTASPSAASSTHTQQAEGVFDPPFHNDEPFREQPFVRRMLHFASKHKSDGLLNAMGTHVMSHVEFGGCLADYSGMNARYKKIRALEDVDEVQAIHQGHPPAAHARVRFVNYYTLSSGRPKPPKSPELVDKPNPVEDMSTLSLSSPAEVTDSTKQTMSSDASPPDYSIEEVANKPTDSQANQDVSASPSDETSSPTDNEPATLSHIDPSPIPNDELPTLNESESSILPPIPSPPSPPLLPDLTKYTDKETKKQLEKESKRLQKIHSQAIKDHEKAVREREKMIQARQKRILKDSQKAEIQAQKEHQRLEKEEKKRQTKLAATQAAPSTDTGSQQPEKKKKKKKLRKFCTLPNKVNGERDQAWVGVYIDGMDEVGAHCGLFFPGPHYEQLVGDVGSRVQDWVHDDLSTRVALRDVTNE